MRKKYILATGIVVVAIGGWLLYRHTASAKNATKYTTEAAAKGTLVVTVSGSGNVVVDQSAKVNPGISGTVANLAVGLGDQVKKGQTLFTITNDDLDVNTNKAYASYLQSQQSQATAQAQLITAKSTYTNQSQDSGQAKAQATLDTDKQQLVTAQNQLSEDQATLAATDPSASNYASQQDKVTADKATVTADQSNVTSATIALQQAQNSAAANKAASADQVTAAESAVAAAAKNVDAALADYNNQKAQAALRTVTAPIDGTITTLNIANGDVLGTNGQATTASATSATGSGSGSSSAAAPTSTAPIIISNLATLKASVQVNEVDAPSVQAGQKASMTFDAIDGLTLTGKVEKIDTVGTVNQGVVTYAATIDFDSLDNRVRPGMSVSADITTNVKQDVLLVPNAAVKSDTNGSYVQILQNGQPKQQTVEVGASNDTDTEITSGINEGDEVVTQTITPTTKSSPAATTSGRGFGFGGGGGLGAIRGGGGGGGSRIGG